MLLDDTLTDTDHFRLDSMDNFQLNDETLSSIINGSPVGMILADRDSKIIFANNKAGEIFGYKDNELIYSRLDQLIPERYRNNHSTHVKKYLESPSARPMGKGVMLYGINSQGQEIPLEIGLSPIRINDFSYVLASIIDVSDHIQVDKLKASNEELRETALHDPLTGLPNKILLFEFIENARQQSIRNNVPLTLIYIDLDGFKEVNDTYGHKTGDDLLCNLAIALQNTIRKSDIVGRLGGDEFLICIQETNHSAELDTITEKLLTTISSTRIINGKPVNISASIGVAICYELKSFSVEQMIQFADGLMYEAKRSGKNRYIIQSSTEIQSAVTC